MIRIRSRAFGVPAFCGRRSSRPRGGGSAVPGGSHRLIYPVDLVIGYRDIVLIHTEEATRPNHNGLELSAAINNEFGDIADLLAVVVVNSKPHHLGGAPLARGLVRHPVRRGDHGRGRCDGGSS